MFESGAFQRASVDGYFLSVELPVEANADKALSDVRNLGAVGAELVLESER